MSPFRPRPVGWPKPNFWATAAILSMPIFSASRQKYTSHD